MRLAVVLALAFVLVAGCLGTDKTFPDESDQVRALHVNAYEQRSGASPRPAIAEISGLGSDQQERAFHGHVRVLLEKALHPEANVQYERAKEYDQDVTSSDFASPTVAYWSFVIPAGDMPGAGSYRVTATATILGRDYGASALFSYTKG